MPNPPGTPIWYELMSPDPDASKAFYEPVVGWTVHPSAPGPDYRMITAADGMVGGLMHLGPEMLAGGARPGWLVYVGVDDPDATFAQARTLGAQPFVPPTDIPGVGRFALLADPQGAPFYIMRGAGDATSGVFAGGENARQGHVAWNELSTPDRQAALEFYGALFGWENRETMDTPMGGYHFLDGGGQRLGALVEQKDQPPGWTFYFQVADLDGALERVRGGGGQVLVGPHPVPTGGRIAIGMDPQGARFALVG